MIDWFPSAEGDAAPDEALRLARWRALVAVRRLARGVRPDGRLPGHVDRVADLAAALAEELGWPQAGVEALHGAALVHDVGLACAPAGSHEHAAIGARIASAALGPAAVEWIRHHHARWDGAAQAGGIPAGALIIALADAYDAMCPGSWEGTMTPEEALACCERERGGRFAPWAVDALGHVVRHRASGAATPPAPLQLLPVPG